MRVVAYKSLVRWANATRLVVFALALVACSDARFQQLGSDLLSSTGYLSSGEASALLRAGGAATERQQGLSPEQEYHLGRAVSGLILSRYGFERSAPLAKYLTSVALVVASASDLPETFGGYRVAVLDTSEVNALSTPGGFIFITRGFLDRIENEEQLAAILAHEVAHVVKGHGTSAISQSKLTSALLEVGNEAARSRVGGVASEVHELFGESAQDLFEALVEKGYSRSQEYEADQYAAQLLSRVGYSPAGLTAMLTTIEGEQGSSGWFDTHPDASSRKKRLDGGVKGVSVSADSAVQARTKRFRVVVKR